MKFQCRQTEKFRWLQQSRKINGVHRGANSTALAVDLPLLGDFRIIYRATALELNSTAKLMFYVEHFPSRLLKAEQRFFATLCYP